MQAGTGRHTAEAIRDEFVRLGVIELLESSSGLILDDRLFGPMAAYLNLVCDWNEFASLTSGGDAARLVKNHLVDSVSLVPYIVQKTGASGTLLDVGSGGGFPAIPIKLLCPDLGLMLVERVARKVGFIRKVIAALGLKDVTIRHEDFLWNCLARNPDVITARAVERADYMVRKILPGMAVGCSFLCQSGNPQSLVGTMFHVEHIDDEWRARGLRRGELYIVTREG